MARNWGRTSRQCLICDKVGPRVMYRHGWAHRRCIDEREKALRAKRPDDTTRTRSAVDDGEIGR
jgi:hypothetical protein